MTIVSYEQPPPLPASRPGEELEPGPVGDVARLRAAAEYASYIADTAFVPDALRNNAPAIAAAILAGGELGIKPIASLRVIAIIKGRPSVSAEGQRGLINSAGHEIWFEETTTTRAIAAGRRAGTDRIGRITWTMDDAKRAGLSGQPNYRSYPAEMLRARASAALARAMFSDVTLGIPATEELEGEPLNGAAGDAPIPPAPADAPEPAPKRTTRRRRPATPAPAEGRQPVAPTPPPDDQPEPSADPIPVTDAHKRKLFALIRKVGLDGQDEEARTTRLAYTHRVVGRELSSWNDLTIGEADRLVADLEEVEKLPAEQRTERLQGPHTSATDATPNPPYGEFPEGF